MNETSVGEERFIPGVSLFPFITTAEAVTANVDQVTSSSFG